MQVFAYVFLTSFLESASVETEVRDAAQSPTLYNQRKCHTFPVSLAQRSTSVNSQEKAPRGS